jgi:hypothetical protein
VYIYPHNNILYQGMDFHEAYYVTEGYSIFCFFLPYVSNTIMIITWTFDMEATQLSLSVEC